MLSNVLLLLYYTQLAGYVTVDRQVFSLRVQFCCCQHLLNLCISVKSLSVISWPWHHFVHIIINQMEKEMLRKCILQFPCAFNLRNVTRLDLIVIKLVLNVISLYVYVLWLWIICIFRLFGSYIISINNNFKWFTMLIGKYCTKLLDCNSIIIYFSDNLDALKS